MITSAYLAKQSQHANGHLAKPAKSWPCYFVREPCGHVHATEQHDCCNTDHLQLPTLAEYQPLKGFAPRHAYGFGTPNRVLPRLEATGV